MTAKRLQRGCFSVNIAKFLRTPNLKDICERLLLIRKWVASSELVSSCFCVMALLLNSDNSGYEQLKVQSCKLYNNKYMMALI